MKKNDTLTIKCQSNTYDGYGVVKHDGFTVFIRNILKDEEAVIKIIKVKKNIAFAIVTELIKSSKHRTDNFCDIGGKCGGCNYALFDYEYQLELKQQRVMDCFTKIAKMEDIIINPILPSPVTERYRNKVQVPFRNNLMGFYRSHSNDIVEFTDCKVQTEISNKILKDLKEIIIENHASESFRHIMIKHAFNNDEIMLVFIVNTDDIINIGNIIKKITGLYPVIKTIVQNINKDNTNVILGKEEKVLFGEGYIIESLSDLKFRISGKSFYQINSYQVENLYNIALDYADVSKDDVVIDLFCGTGTIGIFMARKAKKVIGIEIVEAAVRDAEFNAELNSIDNIEFWCEDANKAVKKLQNDNIDVVVVDPPRKGLKEDGIRIITELSPKRIVYVSCDVATLARDVKIFEEFGYKTDKVQPVDMFPNTNHVECVLRLTKNSLK